MFLQHRKYVAGYVCRPECINTRSHSTNYSSAGLLYSALCFAVSPSTAALSHRKHEYTGNSRDSTVLRTTTKETHSTSSSTERCNLKILPTIAIKHTTRNRKHSICTCCVLCQKKQRLFPNVALTDWFL